MASTPYSTEQLTDDFDGSVVHTLQYCTVLDSYVQSFQFRSSLFTDVRLKRNRQSSFPRFPSTLLPCQAPHTRTVMGADTVEIAEWPQKSTECTRRFIHLVFERIAWWTLAHVAV